MIQDGTLIFVYLSPRNMCPLVVKAGERFQNRIGVFAHDDIINRPFGSWIDSCCKKNSRICVLAPTPELWTMFLPHRTQIIYTIDSSVIVSLLDLSPGKRVVESGTGSGSLTHSLARTVAPHGHVYTFEFHPQRADIARKEFEEHGISNVVTVSHRDVCKSGFSSNELQLNGTIDAVFLDLPEPWHAIKHTLPLFNRAVAGRICCFSPCIEQVQKTCEELMAQGFIEIRMFECLQKSLETKPTLVHDVQSLIKRRSCDSAEKAGEPKKFSSVRSLTEIKGHTAYLTFATALPNYQQ